MQDAKNAHYMHRIIWLPSQYCKQGVQRSAENKGAEAHWIRLQFQCNTAFI